MKDKIWGIVFITLIAVCSANILLFEPLRGIAFDKGFYEKEFDKYNIYGRFNENSSYIDSEFGKVIDYVKGDGELNSKFFNIKEKEHLKDVKNIFSFIKIILITYFSLLAVLCIYLIRKKDWFSILEGLKNGALLVIGFILAVGISSIINFRWTFVKMHQFLFANELWLLDYNTDMLIRMLPNKIFMDIGIRWGVLVIITCVMILLVVAVIKGRIKVKTTKSSLNS